MVRARRRKTSRPHQSRRFCRRVVYWLILARTYQSQSPEVPSKPVNVKQVLVYLTHEQHAALLKLKERLGVPVSVSIRRAIDRYLKQVKSQK